MSTHTDRPAAAHRTGSCGCGCGPDLSCELECQVRPRFFCGQLLTDEDLSTMVRWADGKFRLQRFHDGWGAVCGLDVRCDPANPRGVVVGTGYAVGCCGEDIIVCDEQPLDLSAAFPGADPCAAPGAVVVPPATGYPASGTSVPESMRDRLTGGGTGTPTGTVTAVPPVDVIIGYTEREADPRASLRHSDCVEAPACEAAKSEESFTLDWRPADAEDPAKSAVDDWCRGYRSCLDVLREFVARGNRPWDERRRWLLEWVAEHPPRLFGDLRDLLTSWPDDELQRRHAEVLAMLVLECRRGYTRVPCPTCTAGTGVRLARVYLGQVTPTSPLRVLSVDPEPPYRRPLGPATAPAPPGGTNIGFLVGSRWAQARLRLAELGVRADGRTIGVEAGASDLLDQLDCACAPVVRWGDQLVVQTGRFGADGPDQERVIGFCAPGASGSGPIPPAGPPNGGDERLLEKQRLVQINGIGEVIAEALLRDGLTLEIIATAPEAERDAMTQRVASVFPVRQRGRVPAIVAEIRQAWNSAASGNP